MKQNKYISIIGSGNVAYHLGQRLFECGFSIHQIYSRKINKAKRLAKLVNASAINQLDKITTDADLYIIAISDDAIESVAYQLSEFGLKNKLVVHSSGATPSTILKNFFSNYGVFYPLQSFSIDRISNFEEIPICIDSSRKANRVLLKKIAERISPKVYIINDKERARLHLAAVFVNNFTNHLYRIAYELLAEKKIPFELVTPLLLETANKVISHPPKDMQTGPAKRGDFITINRHLEELKDHPDFTAIYQLLSQAIEKTV